MCVLNCVSLLVTPWTVAQQTPLSMGFLRQEYWSGLTFPSPGYLPNPGIEPPSPAWTGRFFTTSAPGRQCYYYLLLVVNYKGCNSETAKWKRCMRQGMGGQDASPVWAHHPPRIVMCSPIQKLSAACHLGACMKVLSGKHE